MRILRKCLLEVCSILVLSTIINIIYKKLIPFLIYRLECEILVQLTKAQVEIQNWKFLPTLMALYGAQTRMSAWERTLQSKEVSDIHCIKILQYLSQYSNQYLPVVEIGLWSNLSQSESTTCTVPMASETSQCHIS